MDPDGGDGLVFATADIGSTSVHVAVSRVRGGTLESLLDESAFLRLGDRLQTSPVLGADIRAELIRVLAAWRERAAELGAGSFTVVGTEPVRRASDAPSVVHQAAREGIPLHVLDHAEEGVLTLLGATAGRFVTQDLVLVDIGGGSTELVVARPDQPPSVKGIRVGAASLTRHHVLHDPPTDRELATMLSEARSVLAAAAPTATPQELVAVGGTASNLRKLVTGDPVDPMLTGREVRIAMDVFTELPAEALTVRYLINPVRARILPAGACILLALLERYGVDEVRVSEQGIREGTMLAVARAGPGWRDALPSLAQGWTS